MRSHSECNNVTGYQPHRRTRQQAIEAKCKDCIYDPCGEGTWRQQVEQCELTDCALWPYRARSRSNSPTLSDSAPVQPYYGTNKH